MNRSIEQSLTSLLPRLTTDLPSDLINLASSLVAQSRNVASNLKQDEEIGRAYVCAHIACERLKSTLNLPPIEPRPPVPPRVYTKLYTYLSSALAARPQRTPKKVQRLEDAQPPPSNSKTPARRKSNPASTTPAGLPLPSRPTPSKERSLAAFRPQNKSRKSELSHGGRGREIAAWIRPVVRGLCAKMEARGATAHVLAGVGSVLTLPTPKPKKGEGKEKEKVPALVAAVYVLVHTRLTGKEVSGKEYVALRRSILVGLKALRVDEEVVGKVDKEEAGGKGWEGWTDIVGKDVDAWLMQLSSKGWVGLDWFENIESGSGIEGPETRDEPMVYAENEDADEDDDGEEESIMGLGTMMQERVDYLSARKREEYQIWKDGILEKIEQIEKAGAGADDMDTT
ncbi:hypothetical protein VC83_08698 [Pseudogymnoascus destructans]|uniref:ORC6 first cyclin-like domain-containing protein n=1 Tax=Pseudogymnoascus destructans TaxID=655981 RepID=A0A177A1C6_9PEZI|nr:uncharacterized protein VC83_08698 [Pseudogymnoascus destructans]OAF54893.1 hypothetical protein VC83_08698 [Pseudogymnoascus destructans]